MSLVFDRLTEAGWPKAWPIWEEVVRAGDTYAYDPATTQDQARAMWFRSGSEVWRAAESADADPLGIYWLGPNQSGPGSHIANASYMVGSGARNKGVGRQLVLHSLDRARERGFRGIQFNAVTATNVHAAKLYRDLGFTDIGRVPGGFRHPVDGYVDLLIMFREL